MIFLRQVPKQDPALDAVPLQAEPVVDHLQPPDGPHLQRPRAGGLRPRS